MKDEQCQFLSLLGQAPLRLTVAQAAWVLNCQPHDIPVLIAAHLLKPLGNPLANGTKFFSTAAVLETAQDHAWLARMTNAIYERWRDDNRHKRKEAKRSKVGVRAAVIPAPRAARGPRRNAGSAPMVALES